jgi:hypothetical protein
MLAPNLQVNAPAARADARGTSLNFPRFNSGFIACSRLSAGSLFMEVTMNGIIYLIGLVVVIMFLLSLLGLR